jgi:hypothetical protein
MIFEEYSDAINAFHVECGDLSPLSAGDLSPSQPQACPHFSEPLGRGSAWATSRPGGESGDESPHSIA